MSKKGLKIDPEKIEAIKKLRKPTNKKELQTLLGMITYLGKFVSNATEGTEPLRVLVRNIIDWRWADEQEQAFNAIKEKLAKAPV